MLVLVLMVLFLCWCCCRWCRFNVDGVAAFDVATNVVVANVVSVAADVVNAVVNVGILSSCCWFC